MSEELNTTINEVKTVDSEITLDMLNKRLDEQEQQTYFNFLLTNAAVKMLLKKNILDTDELAKEMDELDNNVREFAEKVSQETKG